MGMQGVAVEQAVVSHCLSLFLFLSLSPTLLFSSVLVGRHCPLDEFQCNNTLCKPLGWKCDGEDDCGDNSDENPEECSEWPSLKSLPLSELPLRVLTPVLFLLPSHREVPVPADPAVPLP